LNTPKNVAVGFFACVAAVNAAFALVQSAANVVAMPVPFSKPKRHFHHPLLIPEHPRIMPRLIAINHILSSIISIHPAPHIPQQELPIPAGAAFFSQRPPASTVTNRRCLSYTFYMSFADPSFSHILDNVSTTIVDKLLALSDYLNAPDHAIARQAAQQIDRLRPELTAIQWLLLDQKTREIASWRMPDIYPSDLPRVTHNLTGPLALFCSHRSGFIREAALRQLLTIRTGEELPALLLRVTDWVPAIRAVALHAAYERLTMPYIEHFLKALPMIDTLSARARFDAALSDKITTLLHTPQGLSALEAHLSSADSRVRRAALKHLLEQPAPINPRLLDSLLSSRDSFVRRAVAAAQRRRLTGEPLRALLARLLADRSMAVRREGFYGFVEQLPNDALPVLLQALFDPHPSLRDAARFYLQRAQPSTDPAALYRAHLAPDDPQYTVAIASLGETGNAADAMTLAPLLASPRSTIRRLALRAVGRLDPASFAPVLMSALSDPIISIAKSARDILQRNPAILSPTALEACLRAHLDSPTAAVALSVVRSLRYNDALPLYLFATRSPLPAVRACALDHLHAWRYDPNRLIHPLTPAQHQRLATALAEAQFLPIDIATELRIALTIT
jgi:HEAT repeat protein